jgi:hypothetical protein
VKKTVDNNNNQLNTQHTLHTTLNKLMESISTGVLSLVFNPQNEEEEVKLK